MIKIINEVDGKKYELVPEPDDMTPCEVCAFNFDEHNDKVCQLKDDCFNGFCVCSELRGIWKEIKE